MTNQWDVPQNVEKRSLESTGSFLWESGVHSATVKMAYLDRAASKAVSLRVVLVDAAGKELKEAFYIKSGEAKGGKTTYSTKDGKEYPLPGYSVANSLCISATGKTLAQCLDTANLEKKIVKIYSPAAGKEVPEERPVVMPLLNAKVKVAVNKVIDYKSVKNDAGQYVPTKETRTTNECRFFGNAEGFSAEEIIDKSTAATSLVEWDNVNAGKVIDKTKQSNTAGASATGDDTAMPASNTSDLFS